MLEVAENIFCFPVPLPGSPLKELNCFVIKGDKRHLMVDTGFNTQAGYDAVVSAFKELGILMADTDIFLTHLHADHTGLIEELKKDCGKIFISETDAAYINNNSEEDWIAYMSIQDYMGFPEDEILDYKDHPAYDGGAVTHTDFQFVTEGMRFSYGGYDFKAVDLKGHTPGQMGLYDERSGVFFCGDHILNKITPNINLWDFDEDYLGLFLENLKKVKAFDVKKLLSAHRTLVEVMTERVDALLSHHQRRLGVALDALARGKSTVYEVALETPWDYGGGYFGNFPTEQKWFAALEVFAHLEHLRALGKVDSKKIGKTYHYRNV